MFLKDRQYRSLGNDETIRHIGRNYCSAVVVYSCASNELAQRTVDAGFKDVVLLNYRLAGNDKNLKSQHLWQLKKKNRMTGSHFVIKISRRTIPIAGSRSERLQWVYG
jgi:hypothetical protein